VLASEFSSLASTGVLTLKPGSTNTVPGEVTFSLDIRSGADSQLMLLEENLKQDFETIAKDELLPGMTRTGIKGRGCSVEWQLDSTSTATTFDADCIRCISDSAEAVAMDAGIAVEDFMKEGMISGAGHDRYVTLSPGLESHRIHFSNPYQCIYIEKMSYGYDIHSLQGWYQP
jgi:acetylornithine deacetylase/succinyl-diaminopimelate desuccinylase-like protein